jgi:hypothetical protein
LIVGLCILGLASPSSGADKKSSKAKQSSSAPAAAPAAAADPMRAVLDEAIALARREDYANAAVRLWDIVETNSKLKDEAEYNLAKDLYRLGLYHSAITVYSDVLARGSASPYYSASLEWCLFISRKIVADQRVHETIAHYSAGEFPKEYKDEFHFHLAKFHYQRALAIESGAIAGNVGERTVKDTVSGGKSFGGDVFGDEPGDSDENAPPPAGSDAEKEKVKKKEGGGLSLEEDIFGDDTSKSSPAKDKDKDKDKDDKSSKHGKKGKKGHKGDKAEEVKEEKPKEEAPPPAPPPEAKQKKKSGKKGDKDDRFVLTAKEHIEAAAKDISSVNADSRFGPKAKFLEGLIYYKQDKPDQALESFKSVVRLTKPGSPYTDPKLRELAFFQLARTHFGAQQPSFSIRYYNKVDRDSYGWLDAIYESSWASFRLGNFEQALGNLLTLHSPFFKDEYYPESQILKAVIYYENCRYAEAKSILNDFLKQYEPVADELSKLTERDQPAAKYYEVLANLRNKDVQSEKQRAETLGRILQIALSDRELRHLDASYREVDSEMKLLPGKGGGISQSKLGSFLDAKLKDLRDELATDAGRAVKRKLESERDGIKTLIQQSVRIDIETARMLQECEEKKLQGEKCEVPIREHEFNEWTDDEREVWPFGGEYWRDELGTYQLTLAYSCRASRASQ